MKLKDARLCIDCEELHEQENCPQCASEAFAFLTRWIPTAHRDGDRGRPSRRRTSVVEDR